MSSVLSAGAERSGSTSARAISMPSAAIATVATAIIATSSSGFDAIPLDVRPTKVASAVKAPTVSTSPCENLMTSSTPKNSVKPTATSAYIMPSISPFMMYWASRLASMSGSPPPWIHIRPKSGKTWMAGTRPAMTGHCLRCLAPRVALLLSPQLALAGGVFAVVPFHEFAVLHHVFRDDRNSILAVIVERDLADDRVAIFHVRQRGDDFLAIRTDLLDSVEDHVHRREGEGTVGLRRIVVFLRVVLFHEELAAGKFPGRRAFTEGEGALCQRPEALDISVGDDAGRAVEHGIDAELVHLRADAHADRRQPAEVDHVGIECLDLRELTGEVLLFCGDPEGADNVRLADLGQRFAEIFVVALAVIGRVMNDRDRLVAELGNQLGVRVILVDHGAVDAMHFFILVAIGDVGQHGAPHDHRKAELVIRVDRGDCGRRAVVRRAGDDVLVFGDLGRDLHRDIGFAFVVEHDELVLIFRIRIGIAQAHGQVGRITPAETVHGYTACQWTNEADLDLVLGFRSDGRNGKCKRRNAHSHSSARFTHTSPL